MVLGKKRRGPEGRGVTYEAVCQKHSILIGSSLKIELLPVYRRTEEMKEYVSTV